MKFVHVVMYSHVFVESVQLNYDYRENVQTCNVDIKKLHIHQKFQHIIIFSRKEKTKIKRIFRMFGNEWNIIVQIKHI